MSKQYGKYEIPILIALHHVLDDNINGEGYIELDLIDPDMSLVDSDNDNDPIIKIFNEGVPELSCFGEICPLRIHQFTRKVPLHKNGQKIVWRAWLKSNIFYCYECANGGNGIEVLRMSYLYSDTDEDYFYNRMNKYFWMYDERHIDISDQKWWLEEYDKTMKERSDEQNR